MATVVRVVLETWFSLSRPVGQRFYAVLGFGLVALHRHVLDHVKRRSEGPTLASP
jgi:hypothetical protein